MRHHNFSEPHWVQLVRWRSRRMSLAIRWVGLVILYYTLTKVVSPLVRIVGVIVIGWLRFFGGPWGMLRLAGVLTVLWVATVLSVPLLVFFLGT
jgi:hypothetical protein